MARAREALRDGRAVIVRPAGAMDVPAIARLYLDLSPQAFRGRFHAGQPTPALARSLARCDPPAVCLVAAVPGEPGRLAAEARYVPAGDGVAELALAVLDGYQGAGLGSLLLAALVARAADAGLRRLRAEVSLGNAAMLRLLESRGCALAGPVAGFSTACLEISATGGMPGWPDVTRGRRVLVERRGLLDDGKLAALRAAGDEVRQCPGPRRGSGRGCPLVDSGHCRLAARADLILALLPADDEECAAVLAAHRRHWPHRLAS